MGGSPFINGREEETLDNFYFCPFSYGGYNWTSSEQAYQGMKFKDLKHRERILLEREISIIYHLGSDKFVEKTDEWNKNQNEEKRRLMYEINKAKITQNEWIKKLLIDSKGEIEYRGDRFWGKKGKNGLNVGGKIIMKIRDEMRDEKR